MMAALTTSDLNVVANTEGSYEYMYLDYKKCVTEYAALYNEPADFIIGAGYVGDAKRIATEAKKRGIKTYHIFEPGIEGRCNPAVYVYVDMYKTKLDAEALCNALKKIRNS